MKIYRLVFSPIEVNTYILADDSGRCAVIDCGCYNRAEFAELEKLLDKEGLVPELLLNTHCHLDHILGNWMFLEKYGLKSWSHKLEEYNRLNATKHAMFFGLEMKEPPEPAGFIEEGETVKFGTVDLLALHIPGHSAGSLSFYCEKESVIFTGDALFAGSIGRSDLPGGDHDLLLKSISTKLFTLPPGTVVYPGHGDSTTIGHEIQYNKYFRQ